MSTLLQRPPAWDGVDFTPDFRLRIINGVIPLVFASVSFAILFLSWSVKKVYKAIKRRRRRQRMHRIGNPPSLLSKSQGGHSSSTARGNNNNGLSSSQHHLRAQGESRSDSRRSISSSIGGQSDDYNGDATSSFPSAVPLPQVIIETEAEHDAADSHDLMFEAENAVIRAQVKEQGIVWPGAFKALGMLKEKEDHHRKPTILPRRYLAVPGDGQVHDSDSWIQWWKSPRKKMSRKLAFFGDGKGARGRSSARHYRRGKRKNWTWRALAKKLVKKGKKDFIQALLAWSIVAVLFTKAAFASNVRSPWKWVPGVVWTYFTLLMEVRQYTALLHRSPFRTRKYDRLSYHIGFFILGMMLLSLLELRSVVIQHHFSHNEETVGLQSATAALSLIVFLMEVLTPRPSNFIRKTKILQERADFTSPDVEDRSPSPVDYDERDQLLPSSHEQINESEDDDEDLDEEEEMLAALDLMPDDLEEEKAKERKINVVPPLDVGVSLFSLATYTYIGNFLFKHARTLATFSDVPDLRADDKSASVVLEFRASCRSYPRWLRKRSKSGLRKRPPIFLQICWYFLPELAALMSWAFLTPWLAVLPSLFINLLLNWTTARSKGVDAQAHVAVLYIAGMFCAQMAVSLTRSRSLIMGRRLCIRAKALVITEVFTKALRRKDLAGKALVEGAKGIHDAKGAEAGKEDEGPATAGRIQNLVSVDATRISEMFAYTHFFFPEGPFTIIIAVAMLFRTIGFSAFAAVGAMLCLGPYQSRIAQLFMRFQNQVLAAADERLSLSTEVFQAIKVLKFFAWERKFAEKLEQKRAAEVAALKRRVFVFAAGGMMLFGAPVLIALVTFIFHTKVFHQPLTAATAFTALALFNVIRAPIEQLADMASQLMSAIVSCSRVDNLLDEEETAKYAIVATPSTAGDPKIGFVNASFTWADADTALNDSNTFRLKNLNLTFVIDGLNLIVGPVGSGKSSLLYALLGEMNLLNGKCFLPSPIVRDVSKDPSEDLTDTVAFCSQTPWLLNDTIRNNILFGCTYNARRYRRVLQACALVPDIEVLDLGDRTEVGEKGTVLSGGQKARISLARAIYSPAKVILLDDVLSAVDAHTARHLYNNCLTSDKLMRGRTRILVTHALHLTIPLADYMVALANGYVVFDGPAADYIVASGANTPGLATGQDFSGLSLKGFEKDIAKALLPNDRVEDAVAEQAFEHTLLNHDENPLSQEALLSKAERQDTGAVGLGVYSFYGKAFGSLPVIAAVAAVITLTEICAVSTNWSLRLWASSFDNMTNEIRSIFTSFAKDVASREPDYYLRRYVALAAASLILFGSRMLFFLWRGTVASKVIYHDVMKSLLAAPVRFYDTTPLGRIMNRLSSDMETVDQDVPSSLLFFTLECFATISVLVAIAIALPAFLIAGAFISLAYLMLGWLYISSSRELKRIEAVTRSPVYSLVGESLLGVTSIRAYSDASRFTSKLFNLIDDTNRPFIALWHTNRWLSVRSDLGGACFALVTACFIVATKSVSASLAGFALTYALIMEERILWIVRLYASSQIAMNSVERVREYTIELPQEPQGGKEPPAYWPSNQAGIQVEKLGIRYSDNLPLALKGISFEIKPSERVAIVGRTGSGKSTLALSFFRFVEASGGKIIIDGVDIASISLYTLRDRLTIIPQDAALFSGTVRFNLDPFEQYSDADLYDVLRRTNLLNTRNKSGAATPVRRQASTLTSGQIGSSHLGNNTASPVAGDYITKGKGTNNGDFNRNNNTNDLDLSKTSGITSLDDKVHEGAKNFSAGQRQLLCLARGLLKLRNSNVLVLDESTANLDHETDLIVQAAIREEIGDKAVTVLCIAHRLHTIIDFDRVLVLSNGQVVEYDTPSKLLSKGEEGSEFAKLCKESGDFDKLKELADEHLHGQ